MHTSSLRSAESASQYSRLMRACCESLESRRLLSVVTTGDQFGLVDGKNLTLEQTDVDGDIIRYSLTGGGTGTLTDTSLDLTGTTAKTTLTITVRRASGGDGQTTVTGITADGPVKTINARPVIVNGDIVVNGADAKGSSLGSVAVAQDAGNITAAGAIGSITAGSLAGTITGTTINSVTTKAANSKNGSAPADGSASGVIDATGTPAQRGRDAIATVKIGGAANGLTIVTDEGNLGNVTINGDATGTQILSAGAARALRVNGVFSNSRIQTAGNTTSVTLGAMDNSNVLVGFAPDFAGTAPASSDDFANGASTVARLGTFTVGKSQKGTAAAQITGSDTLAAAQLGNVRIFNQESTDPPSLLISTLTDPTGKSPNSVRYTDNANPANSFNWHRGQTEPALLQAMLTML